MDYMQVLTIILCVLGAALLVSLIILCIKCMYTVDKMNIILEDASKKLKSVDGIFNAIDAVTGAVGTVSDALVTKVVMLLDKVFRKRKVEDNNE